MEAHSEYGQEFDEAFFKDGYNLCDAFLAGGFNQKNLFAAQCQLYKVVDGLNNSLLSRAEKDGKPTACKMGCYYCCHQTVLATPYELFYLADFVRNKFKGDALEKIKERARSKSEKSSKLSMDRLLKYKEPCPLLHPEGGFCRAYLARPMACRIYLSSDVKSCRDDLANPENDLIYPQLYELPLRVGRMMNEGFHARLRRDRITTLQAFENPIEEGLLAALDEKAFDRWLGGGKVFRRID
ncbi:MAG TPA: YkgJ family cysteine cluster protein [Prolixibacteraceae bacterium]|nr:YkgJ family cysteine cluster protein [Prolixibacteraceae bacterium]